MAFLLLAPATAAPQRAQLPNPVISLLAPSQGMQGQTVSLTLTGSNFPASAPTQLQFSPPGGIDVLSVLTVSAQQVSAQIRLAADAPAGPRQLTVQWGGSQPGAMLVIAPKSANSPAPFIVVAGTPVQTQRTPPQITDFSPKQAMQGSTLALTIQGQNWGSLDALPAVQFSPATGITVLGVALGGGSAALMQKQNQRTPGGVAVPSQLAAQIKIDDNAPVGPRQLAVRFGNVIATAPGSFTVVPKSTQPTPGEAPMKPLIAPEVLKVTPNQVSIGSQNAELKIEGKNFMPGAQVIISGSGVVPIGPVQFVDNTEIRAKVNVLPTATTGGRDLTVKNPDQKIATGKGMLNITPLSAKPPVTTTAQGTAKPAIVIPPQTIKLQGPEVGAHLWNFYGSKHRYVFSWKEAPKEKAKVYILSFREPGATTPAVQVVVSAFYSGAPNTRRDFVNYPESLAPAQVYKLKHGATYEWQVDGYDENKHWLARSDVRYFEAGVYFSDKRDPAQNYVEATISAVPAPKPGGSVYELLLQYMSGGSSSSPVVPHAGAPLKITVEYGKRWYEMQQKAQLASAETTGLGGGNEFAEQGAKPGQAGGVVQAGPQQFVPSPKKDSTFLEQSYSQGKIKPTFVVDMREPFGAGYSGGDVCWQWGRIVITSGHTTTPIEEPLNNCKGWFSAGPQSVAKLFTFAKPGDYQVLVYTTLGGYYHVMAVETISIAPPPCNPNVPLKLAETNPFRLTKFSGKAPGEEPTLKSSAIPAPRSEAEVRYTGKGSIEIEWLVDGKSYYKQVRDLDPSCSELPRTVKIDKPLPLADVGAHTVTAQIIGVAGGDPTQYKKPNKKKLVKPPSGSGAQSVPVSQLQQEALYVGLGPVDLFAPVAIAVVKSPTALKYTVDGTPLPAGVPSQVVFETAQSGTFAIGALSSASKVTAGKISGEGSLELFVGDDSGIVTVKFTGLSVDYDPATGVAKVTSGSINQPLSGSNFTTESFDIELTQLTLSTTSAALSGKVKPPATSGLTKSGAPVTLDFAGAEYFLDPSFGHLYKDGLSLPAADVFSSGFRLESSSVTLDFSQKKGPAPATFCSGVSGASGNAFQGVLLGSNTKLLLPSLIFGSALTSAFSLSLDQTAILPPGLSRKLAALPVNKSAELFGFEAALKTADLTWCGSAFEFGLDSDLKNIPLFGGGVAVKVKLKADSNFSAQITSSTLGPTKIGLLTLKGDKLSLLFSSGTGVRLQTDLSFSADVGSGSGFANLKLKQLQVGPKGELSLGGASGGGWQSLGAAKSVKFYGFGLDLKEVGAGVESGGVGQIRVWLGTSGAFNLTDIVPVNAGISADRIRFYVKGSGGSFSFDGIEVDKVKVDFSYAAVKFKGSIGWKGSASSAGLVPGQPAVFAYNAPAGTPHFEPAAYDSSDLTDIPDDYILPLASDEEPGLLPALPAGGETDRFFGDIDLSFLSLPGGKAGFLVGNSSGKPYFLARLQYNLFPPGIPLGSTPFSLQSILGGVGYKVDWGALGANINPAKPCDALSVAGFDAPLESIKYNAGRTFTLKAGVGIGTSADNGQLVYVNGVLSLVSSGSVAVDAGAWVLGADHGGTPQGCAHLEYADSAFTGVFGMNVNFHDVVSANATAYMGFGKNAGKAVGKSVSWYVYLGTKDAPVNVNMLYVPGVQGYVNLDPTGLVASAKMEQSIGGKLGSDCWNIHGYATAFLSCGLGLHVNPVYADAHVTGSVGGGIGLTIACANVGVGGGGSIDFSGKVGGGYPLQVCGSVELCGEACFIKCIGKCFSKGLCVPP